MHTSLLIEIFMGCSKEASSMGRRRRGKGCRMDSTFCMNLFNSFRLRPTQSFPKASTHFHLRSSSNPSRRSGVLLEVHHFPASQLNFLFSSIYKLRRGGTLHQQEHNLAQCTPIFSFIKISWQSPPLFEEHLNSDRSPSDALAPRYSDFRKR